MNLKKYIVYNKLFFISNLKYYKGTNKRLNIYIFFFFVYRRCEWTKYSRLLKY